MPEVRSINDCWNKIGVWGEADCPELEKHVHCRNCPVYSAAATQLLDAELPPNYLDDWTAHLAQEKKRGELDTHSAVIFRIGAEWLALATTTLNEITESKTIHSIPHRRSATVLGLVNIRGELLICVSLAEALGLEKPATTEQKNNRAVQPRHLVVNRDGRRLVFPADEVYGTHRFKPQELKEVPATVAKATATHMKGILMWQDKSVGCLDEQLLFYTLNKSLS